MRRNPIVLSAVLALLFGAAARAGEKDLAKKLDELNARSRNRPARPCHTTEGPNA